jgi:hypothetical protein
MTPHILRLVQNLSLDHSSDLSSGKFYRDSGRGAGILNDKPCPISQFCWATLKLTVCLLSRAFFAGPPTRAAEAA